MTAEVQALWRWQWQKRPAEAAEAAAVVDEVGDAVVAHLFFDASSLFVYRYSISSFLAGPDRQSCSQE